ncbi:MAG: NADH-quinone oxidoreductase subunit NuoN [Alphaproteobacteria bacterium]|nr:NADH-quinone oxidoreductase subunit NuoN [Alphaproteobacteria bacterium]
MTDAQLLIDAQAFAPELSLAIGGMLLLLVGVFSGDRFSETVTWACVALFALTAFFVINGAEGRVLAFGDGMIADPFGRFMKLTVLAGSALTLLMSIEYLRDEKLTRFEYPLLVVMSTLGMLVMISANDLIVLYLGLELQSLALYVLASFARDRAKSSEAGLKYFVLGALSSGMLLYGASLIYGFTGSTNFGAIASVISAGGMSIGLVVGLVFLLAGLAFKVSAVPFHMWTPDVYEGSPTPVTAFFAAAPKLAAMALFLRVVFGPFAGASHQWFQIIALISVASMILGAVAAIGQANIKRLMAYSSIGHMGYALLGFAAATPEGVEGVLIYLVIYLAMTIGTFIIIMMMRRNGRAVEDIRDLSGLSERDPTSAYLLAIMMFSLAGIPPLAGFFGKWFVFLAVVHAHLYALAIIGFVTSVIGAYYYINIVRLMFFEKPAAAFEKPPGIVNAALLGASGAFVLVLVFVPGPLVDAAQAAAQSLFR